jgi:hypothetical protein
MTDVITEGFGNIPLADRTLSLLSAYAGKIASINGATQVRAARRPPTGLRLVWYTYTKFWTLPLQYP